MSTLARRTDPATSHEAAASANRAASQRAVLVALRSVDFGLTDTEIEHLHIAYSDSFGSAPLSGSRLRTARSELVDTGLVRDLGTTRPTPRGRQSIVWTLA